MIRKTELPEEADQYLKLNTQGKLDAFWNLIENHYEDEWRVQADGSMTLTVDSAMLERVLMDNYAESWLAFGASAGGLTAEGTKFLLHRPEYLIGEYVIKGVYDANQRLVNGERTYFFTQGA